MGQIPNTTSKMLLSALLLTLCLFSCRGTNRSTADPSTTASVAPDELTASVTLMAKIRSCWFSDLAFSKTMYAPSFSPDGTRIAFISDLTGVPQLWTVDAKGGWPNLVSSFDDPVDGVTWSPDGEWLAVVVAPGGGLNEQIFLIHPDGTGSHRLTEGGKENNGLGPWSHDGKLLAFSSNRRSGDAMDIYLYDIYAREQRMIMKGSGTARIADISRDAQRAVVHRMQSRGDDNLFSVNLTDGKEHLLTPHEAPGNFSHGLFSPDGSAVYLSSNKNRDLVAFAKVKLDQSGAPGPLELIASREDAELDDFAISDDGKTAALVWNVAGRNDLSFVDLGTGKSSPGPQLPAEMVWGIDFSKDGGSLAMVLTGSANPTDIWVLDRISGKLSQITHSPHPGVNLDALIRPELVWYTAHDGLKLSGWLYRPPHSTGPAPFVLLFHGGPEEQYRPGFDGGNQGLIALLAQGIGVLAPNIRGSSGFGKRFVNLDNGALRENAIKDIKTSVDYLLSSGIADPKRIGIVGGSYGGYMTMAGLTEYPTLFAAGADFFGVVNFKTFFEHTEPWMAAISKIEYGDPVTEAPMLELLSPITKIDRVIAPTLVLHGRNDTNVPVVEAEQVVSNLKKRGVPVEYILFPDEGHGFRKMPNQISATVAMTRWFAKYLKP